MPLFTGKVEAMLKLQGVRSFKESASSVVRLSPCFEGAIRFQGKARIPLYHISDITSSVIST